MGFSWCRDNYQRECSKLKFCFDETDKNEYDYALLWMHLMLSPS